MAIEFNFIKEEDIPTLKYSKLDWDVVMYGKPYQVIRVPGKVHTIGGRLDHGEGNNLWAYPLNEEMTMDNIVEFNGIPGARWGIEFYPTNYIRSKWDETSIESGRHLIITRNEEEFYDGFMTIHEALAMVLDHKLEEHPLDLNSRDFDKKCIGRKIWYRSEPAIIKSYVKGQACVIIEPDGIINFTYPKEFVAEGDGNQYEDECIKADIFSKHIWWFRD